MATDILVFFVPADGTEDVIEAVCAAGAGKIGDYDECAFVSPGIGQFRPLSGADPTIGSVGELEKVEENRVEITFPREIKADVICALKAAHPYEEPGFHIIRNDA